MSDLPACPKCNSGYTYEDGATYICPECAHVWPQTVIEGSPATQATVIRDAYGNELHDGDAVTVIKDLKVKGAASGIKMGTKVKNIRLVPNGDHNLDCRIEGLGAMQLKSEFVKKV